MKPYQFLILSVLLLLQVSHCTAARELTEAHELVSHGRQQIFQLSLDLESHRNGSLPRVFSDGSPAKGVPGGNAGTGTVVQNGIIHHGGPVMMNGVKVYIIWYGPDWTQKAKDILLNLINNVGTTSYYAIQKTYTDINGNIPSMALSLGGQVVDTGSQGYSVRDSSIFAIVQNAINGGTIGSADINGVYMVLTSPSVKKDGFCRRYCGWHTKATINNVIVKYSFVGNPASQCPGSCSMSQAPSGDLGADAVASIMMHEILEAASDPNLNAWYDSSGYENADKCAWTFGPTTTASNGAKTNLQVNGISYLIQRNWINSASFGGCGMSYTG